MRLSYTEREVNDIIGRHHPDFATLRRELIGARHMQRENVVYWRLAETEASAETETSTQATAETSAEGSAEPGGAGG